MEMEYHHSAGGGGGGSLSNTSSSSDLNHSSSSNSNSNHANPQRHLQNQNHQNNHHHQDPMQSWWESVSKARSRIQTLLTILPHPSHEQDQEALLSLADSDRPARSLLDSYAAYSAVSSALTGSGDDPLCQWLYDTFQQSEHDSSSDLRLVVLSFVPLLAGLYLTRIHGFSTTNPNPGSPSLAGFEAVLLALYSSETKSRAGKPLLVSIPSPAYLAHHPSLYHNPPPPIPVHYSKSSSSLLSSSPSPSPAAGVGVLSPPLEPQVGIKSTKRASILGVAFHCYYKHISQMPPWSKIDLSRFAASWAGDDHCPCALSLDFNFNPTASTPSTQLDDDDDNAVNNDPLLLVNGGTTSAGEIIVSEDRLNDISNHYDSSSPPVDQQQEQGEGAKIPLPWELLQPLLRILGHCLLAPPPLISDEIKDAASVAVRRLYARASHDLAPQAILATRSLVQLDNRARASAMAAAFASASSRANTPKSIKKPEMLLVSK